MRLSSHGAVPVILVLLIVAQVVSLAGAVLGIGLLAVAVWFALPGIALVGRAVHHAGTAWLVGPALGIGFSTTGLLVLWSAGLHSWVTLLVAPLFPWTAVLAIRRRHRLMLALPHFSRRDLVAATAMLVLVPLLTWAPYGRVREAVPDGEAYRAYFTADFVWAMAVTAELAKGDVPPDNPFHHGEPLRYYWASHLLSGVTYRAVEPHGVRIEPVILINGLAFGLAFTAFCYWLARTVGASPGWAAAAVAAGFLANSYEGADMMRAIMSHHDPWETLRDTNIDAVTRWFYKGMAVDGLHRLLLYQPHHLTGYALSLTAVWLVALAGDVTALAVALCAGVLLALGLVFSTFTALIVALATALVFLVRIVRARAWRSIAWCALLAGGPLVAGVLVTRALGYTNPADGMLMTLGLNPVATHNAGWVLFLSLGPLLLVGLPALFRPAWLRGVGSAPAALVLAALAFYFFVDVPDMGGVWVGWRTGHLLLIALAAAAASGLTALWRIAESKTAVAVLLVVAVVLALPTVAIDAFNAQDVSNRHDGAGFPWTLVITPEEREAFDWIRANTPVDAIIQAEPYARDSATWAYVPAFAERRMAAGLPISMVPHRRYAQASSQVRQGIFEAPHATDAHDWAEALQIEYVLIGDRERRAYRPLVDRLRERDDLFEEVFRNDAILLLKVLRQPPAGERRQ